MSDRLAELAAISAVLGGFAITFLSVVLTHADARRRVGVALGLATAGSACFFVSALGWSLVASRGAGPRGADAAFDALYAALNPPLSILFIMGIGLLYAVLGLSGWLRSRPLGITTTVIAVLAALFSAFVMRHFIG